MIYVSLLRGINVGGNHQVAMSSLKTIYEKLGYTHVLTYINSGNILFSSDKDPLSIETELSRVLAAELGFDVKVIVRSLEQIGETVKVLEPLWQNNSDQKTDVIFLWDEIDKPETKEDFKPNPAVDTLRYVNGAIIWYIERIDYKQSGMNDFIKNPLYKKVTVRNCNTVRKVHQLMQDLDLQVSA